MIDITQNQDIVEISLEYPKDMLGNITTFIKNPVITVHYKDGTTAVIDTNLFYRNGYEKGYEAGKFAITNKIKDLIEDEYEEYL